jgi:hypothetical protein
LEIACGEHSRLTRNPKWPVGPYDAIFAISTDNSDANPMEARSQRSQGRTPGSAVFHYF